MIKVLVLGSDGMAGHLISSFFKKHIDLDIYTSSRRCYSDNDKHFKLDVFDMEHLKYILNQIKPDYVVNCIGLLVQDSCLFHDKAIYVNSFFPNYLQSLTLEYSFRLVHISTDCVFDGLKGGYIETDLPNERNIYGRSKALGEILSKECLTVRTSIIGPEIKCGGTGLFHWFCQQETDFIKGYANVFWSGVTTLELAKFIYIHIISDRKISGLVHLSNNEKISKYDLLLEFKKYFNRDICVHSCHKINSDKSILSTRTDVDYHVPSYLQMIRDLNSWIVSNENMYKYKFTIE